MRIGTGLAFIGVAIAVVGMAYFHVDGMVIGVLGICGFICAMFTA